MIWSALKLRGYKLWRCLVINFGSVFCRHHIDSLFISSWWSFNCCSLAFDCIILSGLKQASALGILRLRHTFWACCQWGGWCQRCSSASPWRWPLIQIVHNVINNRHLGNMHIVYNFNPWFTNMEHFCTVYCGITYKSAYTICCGNAAFFSPLLLARDLIINS